MVGKPIGGGVPVAAYGMSAEVGALIDPYLRGHEADVGGVGGTLTGSALALAATRATLANALREEDYAVAVPLATRFTEGVAGVIEAAGLPWHVQQLGCRAEYWFCPPPAHRRRRRRGRRRRARGAHAPLGAQPRDPADPVPQHGAVLAAAHRRPTSTATPRSSPQAVAALTGG